jgi:hypothetical protein
MTGSVTYQLPLHIPQADMLPLLTCLAILFKGNVSYTGLSNDTYFRLDDIHQMGLEGNTTVGREGEASAINPSLWPQSHYYNYGLSPNTDSMTTASVSLLTVLQVEPVSLLTVLLVQPVLLLTVILVQPQSDC